MTTDHVVRAVTEDGAFRVIAMRTTDTVRGVAEAQRASGEVARVLGELLTATVLLRETMAPDLRVQGILAAHDPRQRLVADAWPNGDTRGLVQLGKEVAQSGVLGPGAHLSMMRSLHNGAIAQGVVEISGAGVSGALMQYLQTSEQIVAFAAVAATLEGDRIAAAGGYLVQLLPEVSGPSLASMTSRIEQLPPLAELISRGDASPEKLLELVLGDHAHGRTAESQVRCACQCNENRVLTSLATISRADIEEIVAEGKVLEIECDYCHREYRIAADQLRGLLEEN